MGKSKKNGIKIITPVIGIAKCDWKKKSIALAKDHPNIIEIPTHDLCYECKRHLLLLKQFDKGGDVYTSTEYYKYNIMVGRSDKSSLRRINKFKQLYNSIKKSHNLSGKNDYPIITIDGCRLDGSHRLSIYIHLDIKSALVNIFDYYSHFSKQKVDFIINENSKHRKKNYKL